MRTFCILFVASAMMLSAPSTWAQRPQGGGGGGTFLLSQESVQKELDLSQDQIQQIEEQLAKQRESFSGLRDLSREERSQKLAEAQKANQAALATVLNENQLKRFNEITLQQSGGQALASPRVSTALGLSDEQKTRIGEIQTTARDEMRSLFQGAGEGDREAIREKLQKARAAINEKLLGVLTPEQQTKWKEMTGKPFDGEIRSRFRGGNRGGADGNRRRRSRNADNTEAALPSGQPTAASPLFRLASFRVDEPDDAEKKDAEKKDGAKKDNAKGKKKQGSKAGKKHGAKKAKAQAAPSGKSNRHAREARHRGNGNSMRSQLRGSVGRHRSDRDRAWARVAWAMRARGHKGGPPPHASMARRGPGRDFARGPHRHAGHRGHGSHMAWSSRASFGGPRHHGQIAGFDHHRGHRPPAFGVTHSRHHGQFGKSGYGGHRRPTMAHHGRHDPGRHHAMAQSGGFRGHHGREMAPLPDHRNHGNHAMHGHGHYGSRAGFAGHRGPRPMHMAGFHGHRPHGPGMSKHGQRRGDDSPGSRHRHHKDGDRDGKGKRDRSQDRDDKDRDDD